MIDDNWILKLEKAFIDGKMTIRTFFIEVMIGLGVGKIDIRSLGNAIDDSLYQEIRQMVDQRREYYQTLRLAGEGYGEEEAIEFRKGIKIALDNLWQ